MTFKSIEEALALFGLDLLPVDEIPELSHMFLASGCEVLEMAALAFPEPSEHPEDLRMQLRQALALAGRTIPDRLSAARHLRQLYALRSASGKLAPFETARAILDIFRLVEDELPEERLVGESFGISAIVGLYYSYGDFPSDDIESTREVDRDLLTALIQLVTSASPLQPRG